MLSKTFRSRFIVKRRFCLGVYRQRKEQPSLPNLVTAEEATRKTQIKRKLFRRMFDFLETYGEKVLSSVLPEVALKAVKTFSRGTKGLFRDMKEFVWVNRVLSETSHWQTVCKSLTRRQLEVILTRVLMINTFHHCCLNSRYTCTYLVN